MLFNMYRFLKKYHFQDKNWEIVETSKAKVDQFKRTMPLITDLKNKAMRPRHWDQIQVKASGLCHNRCKAGLVTLT